MQGPLQGHLTVTAVGTALGPGLSTPVCQMPPGPGCKQEACSRTGDVNIWELFRLKKKGLKLCPFVLSHFAPPQEEADFPSSHVHQSMVTKSNLPLLISSILISPWETPTPDFQTGQSSPLLSFYFFSATRLGKGPGTFTLQGSPWLRQAPPSPSEVWGRRHAASHQGPPCSNETPTGELSALLGCREPAQGTGQGFPPSTISSGEYPVLAFPTQTG